MCVALPFWVWRQACALLSSLKSDVMKNCSICKSMWDWRLDTKENLYRAMMSDTNSWRFIAYVEHINPNSLLSPTRAWQKDSPSFAHLEPMGTSKICGKSLATINFGPPSKQSHVLWWCCIQNTTNFTLWAAARRICYFASYDENDASRKFL